MAGQTTAVSARPPWANEVGICTAEEDKPDDPMTAPEVGVDVSLPFCHRSDAFLGPLADFLALLAFFQHGQSRGS